MSNFRIILTGIFGAFIVIGVISFALFRGGSGGKQLEQVTIWGTIPESLFVKSLEDINLNKDIKISVNYIEKDANSFDQDFIESLANGVGPDVILLSQDQIFHNKNKLQVIPYSAISERSFKDAFIEEAELYLASDGIVALPFTIDPLVMYWNRDIFTDILLVQPPSYWDEFYSLAGKITKKDSNLNILRSAVSFGEFRNVANAKEILSLLILQAGNPIIKYDERGLSSVLNNNLGFNSSPTEAAIRFYTEFSNPAKTSYSWNRSLPLSPLYFLSGDLALYFGFASEIGDIKLKNPNLNFDVAMIPQRREGKTKITFGKMQGFALVKSSKKLGSAFETISLLTAKDNIEAWTKLSGLPPVRKDLLALGSADPAGSIFYASAIISKGWLDPNREETSKIFQDMIESTISGRSRISESVNKANEELQNALNKI